MVWIIGGFFLLCAIGWVGAILTPILGQMAPPPTNGRHRLR